MNEAMQKTGITYADLLAVFFAELQDAYSDYTADKTLQAALEVIWALGWDRANGGCCEWRFWQARSEQLHTLYCCAMAGQAWDYDADPETVFRMALQNSLACIYETGYRDAQAKQTGRWKRD